MSIGRKMYRTIDLIRSTMIVVFFSVIIVSCFTDVLFRYLPWLRSLGWTEEILRYLNVWIVLLGASVAVKRKAHLTLLYFLRFFRPEHRGWIGRVVNITILVFLAIFVVYGTHKTLENIQQEVQAFSLSIAWFYMAIPVGSLYMFIDFLLILIYGEHPFYEAQKEE